jgi:AraC family transcriptional regulator of adaptative response/methylated-DNA-[protein]-cysteine methyltransferase
MHQACLRRDASYDGIFFVAVRTTGIFCRPSCPARKPRPAHVDFFPTPKAAVLCGYRPCKRCRPLETDGRAPAWVQQLLDRVEHAPAARIGDADLRAMGIDPARARRYFRRCYGMTFQAYHRARRMGHALRQIRRGTDLTQVALGHGYDSNSGFRDAFERTFGQPPGRGRDAACLVTHALETPLGPLVAAASPTALCLLEFADGRATAACAAELPKVFGCTVVPGTNEHIERLRVELAQYFAGKLRAFTVPLDYPGTAFQQAVWKQLLRIPYGQTISYEDLARRIDRPRAQRAVGMANHHNRIAIVIPCHRVVNKSGALGGYGGGLWRKQFLLELERRTLGDHK